MPLCANTLTQKRQISLTVQQTMIHFAGVCGYYVTVAAPLWLLFKQISLAVARVSGALCFLSRNSASLWERKLIPLAISLTHKKNSAAAAHSQNWTGHPHSAGKNRCSILGCGKKILRLSVFRLRP
jgi:hypothetical protein